MNVCFFVEQVAYLKDMEARLRISGDKVEQLERQQTGRLFGVRSYSVNTW